MRSQSGMTLIEVLVAFAVLAGVLASVLGLLSQNARFMISAEDRLIAGIAADNLIVTDLLGRTQRSNRAADGTTEVGGRPFAYTRTAIEPQQGVLQIEYTVRRPDSPQTLAVVSILEPTQ